LEDEARTVYAHHPKGLRFEKQVVAAADKGNNIALLCGRRAGKTIELILRAAETMVNSRRSRVVFVGLSKTSAREIFYSTFKEMNREHRWGLTFHDHTLTISSDTWMSRLIVLGADQREDIEKIRGIQKLSLAMIDESGSQKPSYMEYMVESLVEPALMDTRGTLILSGTPGISLSGYWYRVSTGQSPGWSIHRWTAIDNPHIDGRARLGEIRQKHGWGEDHPTYRREYLGEWVIDESNLVFPFDRKRNVVPQLEIDAGWQTLLALDFGVGHATAFCALGWQRGDHRVYVLESFARRGLSPSQAADIIYELREKYKPTRIIGDIGGLGKAYQAEMVVRYNIAIEAAHKVDKLTGLQLTSDAIRRGQLVSCEKNETLHAELQTLMWNANRSDIEAGQQDDEAHALLYGYRAAPHMVPEEKNLTNQEQVIFYNYKPKKRGLLDNLI
jgi:hypothetical protein